jgi:hypothetical protein
MMQRLAENHEVHTAGLDRRVLQVAQPEFEVLEAVLLCLGRAELDDLFRVVHGNHLLAAPGEQFTEQPFPRPQIGDGQRRQHAQQQMTKRLPASSRPVAAVEPPGDLVEIDLCLVFPLIEHSPEIDAVGGAIGQFLRAGADLLNEFALLTHQPGVPPVEGPFALTAMLQQTRFLELAQVRRDARLPHARDLLDFVDGEFVLAEQRHDAQPCGIGDGTEDFEGGNGFHGRAGARISGIPG